MSPQSASRGPVERGFVHVPRLWERRCPQRTVDGLCLKKWDVCLIFGIPSWLMPLRDRSGQRWQPSGKPYVVAATEVCSRFIGTCPTLRCTHIVHTLTRQVFLGCCNEVWAHRFPSPHLVPFSSFPLRTLLFLILFMSSLASCPFISLLSFFCAYNGPGLSVYAHIYVQFRSPRFRQ